MSVASPKLAWKWGEIASAGAGASATVFRAEDEEGNVAALKVAMTADRWVLREAMLLARVGRRWGPALLDVGRVPEGVPSVRAGTPYLATTWIPGTDLSTAEASKEMDRRTLSLVVAHATARALDELHSIGIRHGDVKAANVIVCGHRPRRDHADDRGATLIDVGLAATIDGDVAVGGTPRSMAPELRRGGIATPAADLYALGILLAEVIEPAFLASADPGPEIVRWVRAGNVTEEIGSWILASLSEAPGARPSAAWIAGRAAQALGLADDETEQRAAQEARIRRTYLALRTADVCVGAKVDPEVVGWPARWLEEAVSSAEMLAADPPVGSVIAPLDGFGLARWLVALAGPIAASWPAPSIRESALADRLLALTLPPEAWTRSDVLGDPIASREFDESTTELCKRETVPWLGLTRCLLVPRPSADVLRAAEDALASADAPPSFVFDLASALVRRGEVGRAFAATQLRNERDSEPAALRLLRAELARRRGDVQDAEKRARDLVAASEVPAAVRDRGRALIARIAWDAGEYARAEQELGTAGGTAAAEVRALIAYGRGDYGAGLRIVDDADRGSDSPAIQARLEATRGMLWHARGRADESVKAFASAADLAARAGAVEEEATYLTGLAAAAVDEGTVGRAIFASTRAALLWERLERPGLAARALLSRAAAFALVGASHDADSAAKLARERANASRDVRAAAFARWAMVETRPLGDSFACAQARAADLELRGASEEDRARSAARLILWGAARDSSDALVDVTGLDRRVGSCSPAARWEWWGARAVSALSSRAEADRSLGARALAELVALLDVPAPIASRGPALLAGARLAAELGEGELARRLEMARTAAADALRKECPPEHRASLESVEWAHATPESIALRSAQVEQLETIVRALSSRERLRPLLEQVLDTMVLWTGVERGLLLLRAPSGRLAIRVARNLARRDLQGEQLALSMGLAKQAMQEQQTVCATDAFAQVGNVHASVHALGLRSVLAAPLVARGDVVGVVYLDDRVRRGAFGPAELGWVRLVASQAALAIADARDQALLRRAVRRAERSTERLKADLGAREAELFAARVELAEQDGGTRFRYESIAGRSEPMQAMLRVVDRVTASEVPVLLAGESGTGKELIARAIHKNGGRGKRPFVSENCASVPESLLESTLFGHVRGAFTGASSVRAGLFDVADGGTLFLDEIGEMPLSMQTKLLRALQDGEIRPVGGDRVHSVDVRIIGATHRDLEAMVAAGTFREDLFYRLNVVSIRMPPLRERAADIPLLALHFIEKHANGKKVRITRAAMDRLVSHAWPGNVRQLENEIRRALVLADEKIDVADLSDEVSRAGTPSSRYAGGGLKARVALLETQLVREALERAKGNQTRAAKALGISRFGLQKMLKRLGIPSGVS